MSRDALTIGINRYDCEALDDLAAPAKDAEAIAQLLHEHGNFRIRRLPEYKDGEGNPKVGKRTPVTLEELRTAIAHLFTPDGDNVPEAALLYFSGHGVRDEGGQGYLATSDIAPDQGIYGYPLQELRSLLGTSPVKQQIVWLDCCHGGALLDFATVEPGTQGGRDRCFITASREFEPAYINHGGESSVLTSALLTALDPAKKATGQVYAAGLVDEVQAALAKETQVTLGHVTGDRILLTETDNPLPPSIPQNIPRSGAVKFVGRDAVLTDLHERLQHSQSVAVTAVVGMGGIGKTELAIRYARDYFQEHYPAGVCWLRCRGAEIASQIVEFATVEMGLMVPDELDAEQQARWCWRNWQLGQGRAAQGRALVVLDDVTDYGAVEHYLPPVESRFRVLMTTRRQNLLPQQQILSLELLSPAAALELLRELVGERVGREPETAAALCEWLGYLPLGIELVGRYLQQKPDLPLEKMLQRLEKKRLEQAAVVERAPDMTAPLGVAAALELSWEELKLEETRRLAYMLSLFALAPIPWELVEGCLPGEDEEDLEDARDRLVNLSLVRRVGAGVYQLHQLVREYAGGKLNGLDDANALKQDYCRAMVAVAKQVPQSPTVDLISELATALPHLQESATELVSWVEDKDLPWPSVGIARSYAGQGLYGQAMHWYEACLVATRTRLGEEHRYVATSLNNLASLYQSQGRYSEAEPLFVQALGLSRRILGEEHLDVATNLNNLALVYDAQGRYSEAEPLFVQALELRRRILGEDHLSVATSLNNLAGLSYSQGRYSEAEPLFVQALELRCRILGKDHPDVANSLNNLAGLYQSQGRYSEAETLFVQALNLSRRILGEDHPSVASSFNNLALLYDVQGRYSEAEPLFVQALDLRRRILGEDHPSVATSLNNLAGLSYLQGRYSEAEPLFVQALELRCRILGEDHPDVATSLNNLAELYRAQVRYSEAEPLYLQALDLKRRILGEDHPSVATSLNNLALLYDSQGRYSEAEPLYLQALELRRRILGKDHPDVADSLNNLALLYKSQGRYSEAEPLYLQAIEICLKHLGQEHPTSQTVTGNFIQSLRKAIAHNQADQLSKHSTTQRLLAIIRNENT